jgi:hypothetical protein
VQTVAEAGPAGAAQARWPLLEGRLLKFGETALIGVEPDGRGLIRERFAPGSLQLGPR